MRLFFSFLFLFFSIHYFSTQVCDGKKVILLDTIVCNDNPYVLIFEDDFDSGSLDLSKWKPINGVVRDVERNVYQQWSSSNNIEIENGILKFIAKKESIINQPFEIWINNANQSFVQSFDYTSGEINSIEEFSFGKFEIRCKIAKGKGFFPAFWTFGGNGYNEIDVFEFWNEDNIFGKYDSDMLSKTHKMNNHFDYEYDGSSEDCPSSCEGPDFSEDFHIFSMIWTPFKIEWFVDGNLKRISTLFYTLSGQAVDCYGLKSFQEYILNKAFPRNKMTIIANFGIQSGINSPDDKTPFPSAMEIDYIRYYKQF